MKKLFFSFALSMILVTAAAQDLKPPDTLLVQLKLPAIVLDRIYKQIMTMSYADAKPILEYLDHAYLESVNKWREEQKKSPVKKEEPKKEEPKKKKS